MIWNRFWNETERASEPREGNNPAPVSGVIDVETFGEASDGEGEVKTSPPICSKCREAGFVGHKTTPCLQLEGWCEDPDILEYREGWKDGHGWPPPPLDSAA